jgi:hypothetical protein
MGKIESSRGKIEKFPRELLAWFTMTGLRE